MPVSDYSSQSPPNYIVSTGFKSATSPVANSTSGVTAEPKAWKGDATAQPVAAKATGVKPLSSYGVTPSTAAPQSGTPAVAGPMQPTQRSTQPRANGVQPSFAAAPSLASYQGTASAPASDPSRAPAATSAKLSDYM